MPYKRLQAPTRKPLVLPPTRPNAGLEAAYRRDLDALVKAMAESLEYWLTAQWRAKTPATVAQDASGAQMLRDTLRRLGNRWQAKFDALADTAARRFADKTLKLTDIAFTDSLKKAGFAVDFTMTPGMQDAYSAVVGEQVGLIRSIASQHLTQVETVVMQGVQNGRDLAYIHDQLRERYGVTKRRAALIARDQSNKATSTLNRQRQKDLGITKAKWRHSGGGKEPRPSHVAADGQEYDLEKGMYLDGVWTWPGVEINCRCTSSPVIPGFEDD